MGDPGPAVKLCSWRYARDTLMSPENVYFIAYLYYVATRGT